MLYVQIPIILLSQIILLFLKECFCNASQKAQCKNRLFYQYMNSITGMRNGYLFLVPFYLIEFMFIKIPYFSGDS